MKRPPEERLNAYFMHRLHKVRWVTDHALSDTTIYLRREKPLASGPWDFGEVIEHPNGTYEARLKRQCGDTAPISGTWGKREQAMNVFVQFTRYGSPYDPKPIPFLDECLKAADEEIYAPCDSPFQEEDALLLERLSKAAYHYLKRIKRLTSPPTFDSQWRGEMTVHIDHAISLDEELVGALIQAAAWQSDGCVVRTRFRKLAHALAAIRTFINSEIPDFEIEARKGPQAVKAWLKANRSSGKVEKYVNDAINAGTVIYCIN